MQKIDDRALVYVADYFKALAEPMRLKLLNALQDGEKNVGELTELSGCTQANVSKHLSLLAKIGMVKILLIMQIALIVIAAFLLGWNPGGNPWLAIPAVVLGAFAFGGIGLLMAGTLRGTVTLALANGLYLLLLLLGGMIIPFSEMPGFLGTIGKVLPSGALSQVLQSCLRSGAPVAGSAWIVLGVWAVLAPLAAVKFFRWE